MELEKEHSLQNMIKELYAWCHMSKPACVNDHHHNMGAGGKIYRVSHELRSLLQKSVPYVNTFRPGGFKL
jgi:hypothetical protein